MATLELDIQIKNLKEQISGAFSQAKSGAGVSTGGGGNASSNKTKSSISGGMTQALRGLGIPTGIAAIVGILTSVSGVLKSGLSKLMKLLGLLVKPIADVLGILLSTFVQLVAPFARIVNIIWRPYLKAATVAFKTGLKLSREGDAGGSAEAFGLGIAALLKPIMNNLLSMFNFVIQGLLSGIQLLSAPFVVLFGKLLEFLTDGEIQAESLFAVFQVGFNQARTGVNNFFNDIITKTDLALFQKIGEIASSVGFEIEDLGATGLATFQSINDLITDFTNNTVTDLSTKLAHLMGLDPTKINKARKDINNLITEEIGHLDEEIETKLSPELAGLISSLSQLTTGVTSLKSAVDSILDVLSQLNNFRKKALGWVIGRMIGTGLGVPLGPLGMVAGGIAFGSIGVSMSGAQNDFIMRPGQSAVPFSPDDTVIGVKDLGSLSGGGNNITVNVNVDKLSNDIDVRQMADDVAREVIFHLRLGRA